MMKNIQYIFFAIIVSLFSLTSCGLEEPYTPEQSSDTVIEFVGRPVGFNNQNVDTKAEPEGVESTVNSCYFLLFDNTSGNKVYMAGGPAESLQSFRIPKTELAANKITSLTACYLVNVPSSFVNGITGLTNPNPGTNDNKYISTAVIDIPEYQSGTPMGVPVIDGKAGIPMYGQTTTPIEISKYTTPYEIPVKRLFAKATVSLKMNLTTSGSGLQANSYMQMTSYGIYNLPQKVKLTEVTDEDGYESAWVKNAGTGLSTTSSNKIYNQAATGIITDLPKELVFHCYVPEYYLLPKSSSTQGHGQEEYKPLMFDNTDNNRKYPVYIQLNGSYEPVSGVSQNLTYKIYLGENASTNFTLKRNTHYTNNLVIKGVENKADGTNGKIDHRVTITQGDIVSMYGEVANCYMIGKEGKYNFPAYKGAYKYAQLKDAPMCTSGIAKIIASDNNSIWLKDENITVTTDELTGEQIITINVTNGDDTANEDITIAASGNAILALLDDNGNIEWSWHLWFTGGLNWGLGNMEFFEMATQDYPNGDLMDRNLGANPTVLQSATPGLAIGLYYKYGCKDPYLAGSYKGGGALYDANGEEIVSTWSSSKSPTDPCPPGYKVPNASAWQNADSNKSTELNGFLLYRSSATSAYYPYSNYLLANGNFNEDFTDYVSFQDGYSFSTLTTDGTLKVLYILDFPRLCEYTYTMTDMDIQTSKEEGRLWCVNGYISYKHNTLNLDDVFDGGIDALRPKLQINQYTQTRRLAQSYGIRSLSQAREILQKLGKGELENAFLESLASWGNPESVSPNMSNDDRDELLARLILLEMDKIDQTDYKSITSSYNKSEGYQVRCVVDVQQ